MPQKSLMNVLEMAYITIKYVNWTCDSMGESVFFLSRPLPFRLLALDFRNQLFYFQTFSDILFGNISKRNIGVFLLCLDEVEKSSWGGKKSSKKVGERNCIRLRLLKSLTKLFKAPFTFLATVSVWQAPQRNPSHSHAVTPNN